MKKIIIIGLIVCIILTITNITYSFDNLYPFKNNKSTECFEQEPIKMRLKLNDKINEPIKMRLKLNEELHIKNYNIISNNKYIFLLTDNNELYKLVSNSNNSLFILKINLLWNDFIINKNLGIGIKNDMSLWVCDNKYSQMFQISYDKWKSINIDFDTKNNMYIIYGIKIDNSLWKFFYTDNFDPSIIPVINKIDLNLSWKTIYQDATNNKTLGILTTGELYGWGNNDYGSLGINVKSSKENIISKNIITIPTLINSDKWLKISLLNNIIFGIKEDLSLYIWVESFTEYIQNDKVPMINFIFNQILINDIKYKDIQIINLNNSSLNTSKIYIYAISDNNLWTMGYNYKGMLGTQNTEPVINLLTLTNNNTGDWKKVISFNGIFYGIKNNNTLWSWGRYNIFNQFALFDEPDISIIIRNETQISNLKWKDIYINPIYSNSFNTFYCLGITEDNKLYGWGFNKGNILHLDKTDLNNNTIDHLGQTYYAVKEPILINLPNN